MTWAIIWAHGITDIIDTPPAVWGTIYAACLWLYMFDLAGLQTLVWASALHFNGDVDVGVVCWALFLSVVINAFFLRPNVMANIIHVGMSLHTVNHLNHHFSWLRIAVVAALACLFHNNTHLLYSVPANAVGSIVVAHCLTQHWVRHNVNSAGFFW